MNTTKLKAVSKMPSSEEAQDIEDADSFVLAIEKCENAEETTTVKEVYNFMIRDIILTD